MTAAMLNRVTVEQLQKLHQLTKREFMSMARNHAQVTLGNAEQLAASLDNPKDRLKAQAIVTAEKQFLGELETLFAERES